MFKKKREVIGRSKAQKTKKLQSLFTCFSKQKDEGVIGGDIQQQSTKDTDEVKSPSSTKEFEGGAPKNFVTSIDPAKGFPRQFFEIEALEKSGRRVFHLNGTTIFYVQMNPPGTLYVKVELSSGCELDWMWRDFLDTAIIIPHSDPNHHYATLNESTMLRTLTEQDGTTWELSDNASTWSP